MRLTERKKRVAEKCGPYSAEERTMFFHHRQANPPGKTEIRKQNALASRCPRVQAGSQ